MKRNGHPNAERKALLGKGTGLENRNNAISIENGSQKQKTEERKQTEVNVSEYHPPSFRSERFHCPYCHAYASHSWTDIMGVEVDTDFYSTDTLRIGENVVHISFSSCCDNPTFWCNEKIIYPPSRTAPPANSDLPVDVKAVYEEASTISNQSPRAACAMLRLAIEMLLKELGEKGDIFDATKNLVKKGLDQRVQQSLDIVRVIGNNAVHPGEIVFDDTTDVQILFQLINIIANYLITQPKQIQEAYDNLPEDARKAIEERDSKTQ